MKITKVTNTQFTGSPLKISAKEYPHVKNLTKRIMAATSVYGSHRTGSVIYKLGEDSIEIAEPTKGFIDFLKELGIKLG